MESALFISIKVMCVLALVAILLMVINKMQGKDELDGLFRTGHKRKENK
jgi:hypothetical protein